MSVTYRATNLPRYLAAARAPYVCLGELAGTYRAGYGKRARQRYAQSETGDVLPRRRRGEDRVARCLEMIKRPDSIHHISLNTVRVERCPTRYRELNDIILFLFLIYSKLNVAD